MCAGGKSYNRMPYNECFINTIAGPAVQAIADNDTIQ